MARSSASSITWPPVRPVTASHSSPDSRSRIEVSSKNPRTSLGLELQHLLGQIVEDVAVAAVERRHEAGNIRLTSEREAASCSPAAQPSVRAVNASTAASDRCRPAPP